MTFNKETEFKAESLFPPGYLNQKIGNNNLFDFSDGNDVRFVNNMISFLRKEIG